MPGLTKASLCRAVIHGVGRSSGRGAGSAFHPRFVRLVTAFSIGLSRTESLGGATPLGDRQQSVHANGFKDIRAADPADLDPVHVEIDAEIESEARRRASARVDQEKAALFRPSLLLFIVED